MAKSERIKCGWCESPIDLKKEGTISLEGYPNEGPGSLVITGKSKPKVEQELWDSFCNNNCFLMWIANVVGAKISIIK